MNVLVVGETCLDIFRYGSCDRLAPEAPVPVFTPTEEIINPGMAMHVMKNAESLGANCSILTNDNWEEVKKIRYVDDRTNQMFIRIDENDNAIKRGDVNSIDFDKYDAIIVSDYNKGFLTEEDMDFIFNNHAVTFLDSKKVLGSWARNARFIKINSLEFAASQHNLGSYYDEKLIVTTGKHGCRYNNKSYTVDNVEIKDFSGAGDTFIAALTVSFIKDNNIDKAIRFANECSTKVVQRRGVTIV